MAGGGAAAVETGVPQFMMSMLIRAGLPSRRAAMAAIEDAEPVFVTPAEMRAWLESDEITASTYDLAASYASFQTTISSSDTSAPLAGNKTADFGAPNRFEKLHRQVSPLASVLPVHNPEGVTLREIDLECRRLAANRLESNAADTTGARSPQGNVADVTDQRLYREVGLFAQRVQNLVEGRKRRFVGHLALQLGR